MKYPVKTGGQKWTWEDLASKIDNEGFDYFWINWLSPDDIVDKELKKLAQNYIMAEVVLREYLEANGGVL